MSSIAEQQNLLWKVYQQHRSILNNCSIELNKPNTSVINDTQQHQQYLNHSISVVDDDDMIAAPSTTAITTTDTITSFNNSIDNSNDINPCDSKLMSDIGSMIVQLERLITHTNAGENIVGDDSAHQHQHVGASDMDSVENNNYGNQTFNYGVGIGAIGIGGGGSQQQQIRTDQFYIKYPHDMLHPSMNPCVIGNSVVIATWSMHGKFRSPTAVFLVSLAIADLLLLLVFVPLETLEYFMITWTGMSSICKMIAYVEAISAMATVMNLVAVSTERFLVIVYPMRARSWCTMSSTRKGLIIIWSFAFVLSTPVLLTRHTSQITYYNSTTSLTLYYCFDVENDLTFIVAIYQLLVMFILPALFMVVCYYVVIRQLWISTRSVNLMTQAENQARQAFVSRKSNYSLMHRKNITNINSSNARNFENEKSFCTDYTQVMSSFNNNNNGNVEEINLKRLNESTETTTALTVKNHITDHDNISILSSRNNKQDQHQPYDKNKVITTEIGNYSIETLTDSPNELNNNSSHLEAKPPPPPLSLQQSSAASTKNKNYKINKNSIIIIDTTTDKWNDNNIGDNFNPLIEINVDNVDDDADDDDEEVIEIRVEPQEEEEDNNNNEDANTIVVEVASTAYQMSNFIINDYNIQNNNENELNPLSDNDANIDSDNNNYNHDRIVEFHQNDCNANQQQKQQQKEKEIQRRTKIESESELNDPDDEKNHLQPKPSSTTTTTVQARSRNLSSNVMEITKSRIQVIKMLVLIIVLFLLCWGPRLIMNVLVKSGLSTYSSWIYNTRVMCNLLSFIHSALNPFVYGFMSSNFRSMVCSSFGSRRRRRNRNNNNKNDNKKLSKQLTKPIFSENLSANNSIVANINTITTDRHQEIK